MKSKFASGVEVRIQRSELIVTLGSHYEFLWYFGKKIARCRRCRSAATEPGPYRIYVNELGDFLLYHRCGKCNFPLRSYVDLSQDPPLRRGLRRLYLSKFN